MTVSERQSSSTPATLERISSGSFFMPGRSSAKRQRTAANKNDSTTADRRSLEAIVRGVRGQDREADGESAECPWAQQYRSAGGRESAASVLLRKRAYEYFRVKMNAVVDEELERVNGDVLHALKSFVEEAYTGTAGAMALRGNEIPTGLVLAGINIQDHRVVFGSIVDELQSSEHVVITLGSENASSLKQLVKAVNTQYMEIEMEMFGDGVIEAEEKLSALAMQSLETLVRWYSMRDPTKIFGYTSKERSNVVIFLRDFEMFEPKLVQTFVAMLSAHQSFVPFVLLFGIATSVDMALAQCYPPTTVARLQTQLFEVQQSKKAMHAVVERLFIRGEFPFMPSQALFQQLVGNFDDYNQSIFSFRQTLNYILMDSFFSNPLTVLCAAKIPEADKDEWPEWTDAFLTAHSEALLITPAFQQYLDSIRDTYGRHARLLLSDKVYLAKQLPAWMEAHCANSRLHTLGTVCLMHVVTSSRKAESRRSPAELLCDVLSTTFFESGQLDTLFRCLKFMHLDGLTTLLTKCTEEMATFGLGDAIIDKLRSHLKTIDQVKSITSIMQRDDHERTLKRAVHGDLLDVVKHCLQPALDPLRDVFTYTAAMRIKKSFCAQPRASLQTALGKSVHYLGFATEADGTYADEDDEDICIAYQLYLEAGRLINLHDWFVGFAEIAGQGGRVPEQQVLARFIRCITELQWLGFVRSTKRKTDHVQRMTWGA